MTAPRSSSQPVGDGFARDPQTGAWAAVRVSVAFGHLYIAPQPGAAGPMAGTTQSIALSTIRTFTEDHSDGEFHQVTMTLAGGGSPMSLRLQSGIVEAVRAGRADPGSTIDLGAAPTPPPLPPSVPAAPATWTRPAPAASVNGPLGSPVQPPLPQSVSPTRPPFPAAPYGTPPPQAGGLPLGGAGAIPCTICNQQFNDIGSLTRHHQTMHSGSGNAMSASPPKSDNRLTWVIAGVVVAVIAVVLLAANAGSRSDVATRSSSSSSSADSSGSSSGSSSSASDSYTPPAPDTQDILDQVWDNLSYTERSDLCDAVDRFGVDAAAAVIVSGTDGALSLSDARTFLQRKC